MIYLRESEVAELLSMPAAIDAVREAFQQLGRGAAENVPRVRAQAPGIVLHSMSASADYLGLVGWKQYTTTRAKAQFLVGVYEQASGDLLALLEADRLGQIRTGATTGLAVSCLAPTVTSLGLFGSGWQAESQLEAVASVCQLEKALVFSRRQDRLRDFCTRMSERLGLPVEPADDSRHAIRYQPLIITATTSAEPVFEAEWLPEETLVCAVGSNWLRKAELDSTTIKQGGLVVCDSVAACRGEAGDFAAALESADFNWEQAVELSDVAQNPQAYETEGLRIFKSVGLALEDLAVAAKVLNTYHRKHIPE